MSAYTVLLFFVCIGAIIAFGAIIVAKLISYRTQETAKKGEPYECGVDNIGSARIQFHVGFYIFALLFLIFDIESLFLFPSVKIFKSVVDGNIEGLNSLFLLGELGVFVTILATGLTYAWRKGVLKWD